MPINYGNALSKAGAPTSGVFQVETATAAGTVSGSGNAAVVVTAAGMTGSPITLSVAVTSGDTAAVWAGKVRTALAANATIAAFFTVSGATTAIILTRTQSAANDATLNISLDNDTSTGITTAATSANTTAGVRGDFRGVSAGQTVVDTTNYAIYQNSGNELRPVWSDIS